MKAAQFTAYGGPDVIRIDHVPQPVPRPDELLVQVHAATVSSGDARVRAARFPRGFALPARLMFGLTRPRRPILGADFAGTVVSAGAKVTRFRPGDRVLAFVGARFGCHAEFATVPERAAVVHLPPGIAFDIGVALAFGGTTALHFLRDVGRVRSGERVLINGASGAVGSAAIELARHFGAHVTGVCSAANAPRVRALGADAVIDYASRDFAASGERWDLILDTIGNAPFARSRSALSAGGRLLLIAAGLDQLIRAPFQSRRSGLVIVGGTAPERAVDLEFLISLCLTGKFSPVIDRHYPLERIAEAHARVDSARKVGSVVVTMPCFEPAPNNSGATAQSGF